MHVCIFCVKENYSHVRFFYTWIISVVYIVSDNFLIVISCLKKNFGRHSKYEEKEQITILKKYGPELPYTC